MRKLFKIMVCLGMAWGVSACVSTPNTLYYWGEYTPMVYQRLKQSGSPSEQIQSMERYFQRAEAENLAIAPGAHAHLGLLLTDVGNFDAASAQFALEKARFPESAPFMEFLLKDKRKPKRQGGKP